MGKRRKSRRIARMTDEKRRIDQAAARKEAARRATEKKGDRRKGDNRGTDEYNRAKFTWRCTIRRDNNGRYQRRDDNAHLPRLRVRESEKFEIPQLEYLQLSRKRLTRAEWVGARLDHWFRLSNEDKNTIKNAIKDRVPPGQFENDAARP